MTPIALNLRSQTVTALLDVLPRDQQVINLLIDTYFDRVHWFMLVFRQDTFRERFRTLISRRDDQSFNSTEGFSFACTVLTVAALGLQHTCAYRKQRLAQLNVEPNSLLLRLLSTIQSVLFDLIAIGSLESVQVCVLVGSFYLFHGCPGPALPVIGCGLRIAQGMGLHRRSTRQNSEFSSKGHETEDAKRCWLALFEIDRFCSMVYGLPISFANEDCDIGRQVLSPLPTDPSNSVPTTTPPRDSMLLFYKGHMSELSIILTEILQELYTAVPRRHDGRSEAASFPESHMQLLSRKIGSLDRKLRSWYEKVHPILHLEDAESKQRAYASSEAMAQDVGGSGERFEHHVLRMQAMTLRLAFENAIIMTHRPLLSFRSPTSFQSHSGQAEMGAEIHNPYKASIERCRKAALNIAAIGSFSAFDEALDTYAVSFLGIHVFTAGVVLCLTASFEPMTSQAHEAKAGIQKLMAMQRKLQERSVVAAQGLKILEKVVALVIDKELQEVLGHAKPNGLSSHCWNDGGPPVGETHTRPKQKNDSEVYGMDDSTVRDNQPGSRGCIPNGAGKSNRQTDMGDPSLSQPQFGINADPSTHAFINTASDHNYGVEGYDPYLGSFSTDIEQGWIWDPDWLVHM
ncbi:hypothetical protein DL98DRAFT_466894 [Cadophora sp. DSE1049]|nr:hypothetical protein DL98DRAFT_466894 [Cadophora sp. DSE1049]